MRNTLFKDELHALENASPEEIRNTLMRFFDPFWEITPMNSQQIDVLRSIIHPEIVLVPPEPTNLLIWSYWIENKRIMLENW